MKDTPNQGNATENVLLLRQLEEVESCGQICHFVLECGSSTRGCFSPLEEDIPSE